MSKQTYKSLGKKNIGSSLGVILFEYLVFGLFRLVSWDILLQAQVGRCGRG
jgi:hypothetical protein